MNYGLTFAGGFTTSHVKCCRKCRKVKPSKQFYPHPKVSDGYQMICIACMKQAKISTAQ